jgi:glutathione S-transferase
MSVTEQKSAAYLKINKRGQVPVLIADGEVIVENLAIQNYIAKTFPEAQLAPTDVLGESRWLSTLAWISNSVHPSAKRISRPYYFATDESAYESIRKKHMDDGGAVHDSRSLCSGVLQRRQTVWATDPGVAPLRRVEAANAAPACGRDYTQT